MKNKFKPSILFLIQLPPPIHGASLMNEFLVNSKKLKNNFDIEVLNLDFVSKLSEIGTFTLGKLLRTIKFSYSLLKTLLNRKYNLVYFTLSPSGGAFYRDLVFVFILKIFKSKIVYHLHGKGISIEANNKIKKLLYKYAFNNTQVICLSKMLQYDIEEVHSGPIHYVANGIPKHSNVLPGEEKDKSREIVYLSNLSRSKGVLVLLEALQILQLQNINFSAKIIGNSTNDLTVENLEKLVKSKNLNKEVQVLGPIYGEDRFVEITKSGIFCFPTFYKNECFPLSILESMMVGLVPVSTNNGAIPEIIDHEINGLIVKKQDPLDLAEKLSILVGNKNKVKEMSQMAQQKFNELYTIDIFEKNIIDVFNKVLGRKNI